MSKPHPVARPRQAKGIAEVPLRDVADLIRAPLIKTNASRGGTVYGLASIGDLPDHGFIQTPQRSVRLKAGTRDAERFMLEDFDVLMTMVGTIDRIGIVPSGREQPWLPASNMVVVRFRDRQLDRAVAFTAYMRSDHGNRILTALRHGRTIPIISKKAFSRTPIPELTPELQKIVRVHVNQERTLFEQRDTILDRIEQLQRGFLSNPTSAT